MNGASRGGASRRKPLRKPLRVYTCDCFQGFNPVGVAAVVVAKCIEAAAVALTLELSARGLHQTILPDQLMEVELSTTATLVLNDGDY